MEDSQNKGFRMVKTLFVSLFAFSVGSTASAAVVEYTNFDYQVTLSGEAVRYTYEDLSYVFDGIEFVTPFTASFGFFVDGLVEPRSVGGLTATFSQASIPSSPQGLYYDASQSGLDGFEASFTLDVNGFLSRFSGFEVYASGSDVLRFDTESFSIFVDGYGFVDTYGGLFTSAPFLDGFLFIEAPEVTAYASYSCVELDSAGRFLQTLDCAIDDPGAIAPVPIAGSFPLLGAAISTLFILRRRRSLRLSLH